MYRLAKQEYELLFTYLCATQQEKMKEVEAYGRAAELVARHLSDPAHYGSPAVNAIPALPFCLPPYAYSGGQPVNHIAHVLRTINVPFPYRPPAHTHQTCA